jgi:hypothetical protein
MPVLDHPIHESTRQGADARYGCYNRGPFKLAVVGSLSYGAQIWKHRMSTACRNFYLWDTDPKCAGCTAERDHDYADTMKELK